MKNRILLLVFIFSFANLASSQFDYSFSSSSSAYTYLTGPTTVHAASSNEVMSGNIGIGFTFRYNCTNYTQLQICTEGWVGFGGGLATSSNNNLATSTINLIAPLWDDIRVGGSGLVRRQLTGTAPNRVFTVEWYRMRWQDAGTTTANGCISFQMSLYETSNNITFNYTNETGAVSSGTASIGLSNTVSGGFYSINSATNTVSTTTETNTISARPAANTLYTFAPVTTPTAGTASASTLTTTCAASAVNFSLTGASSGCGVTYQWQSSPDNVTWSNISGATSTSYSTNVLVTSYFRCDVTYTSSGLSATSNVVTITSTAISPINDLPCSAINLTLGAASSGNNSCASNSLEPAAGSCWTGGNVNTVWYSVVVPASGQLKIKTIIQSGGTILQRTQIALYSGTCGALTQVACNVNAPACGSYTPSNSEITATGLTPGATYYISVDGLNSDVGSFSILAINGNQNFPYVEGQDCPTSFTVCNPITTIGNPGYQAIGGSCDHNTGNCTNGEANSIWYVINIDPALVGSATLTFDIVPNDYGNPNPITGVANPGYGAPNDETDYDFVLWKVSGAGATNCAGIQSGAAPAACNFDGLGTTGCSVSGNSPAAYPGFNNAYEVGPTVIAGEAYVLVIQNYANSTSGLTVQIPLAGPVVYTPPTTVYWSGGAFDSDYTDPLNWGGCNAPACGVTAIVTASSSNQPVLPAGTYGVKDLNINPGASLTLQSGATLQICGDFTNDGSLVCMPGSSIEFIGTGVQTITGAFENSDAFHHFTVNKLTGSVVLANNIDVKGNFLTNNNTSVLNTAGRRVRVGGNFSNAAGNTTFSNTGTLGTLTFNGTGAQTYTQGSSQLDLNFVEMNKPSGVLTLLTNMFIKSSTGTLTLTAGKITTNAFRVDVANNAPTSVSTGNVNSYVNGNLYRAINGLGSYDFPVGTLALYERANINFTVATAIPVLQARFDPWSGSPNTLALPDCAGTATYNIPSQNMGVWTINASASGGTGTYNVTLYSTGATNTAGAVGWTVQKASTAAGPWTLNGGCSFSTVSVIVRNGLTGFSAFGVAQSSTPLPIELTNFQGYRQNDINFLKWTTASEINSDYFEIERSRNGKDFESIEKINAQGNSNTPIEYITSDVGQYNSINYYRLKAVDNDGSYEYSKIISITSEISSELKISDVYPNPGTTDVNFNYSVARLTETTVRLIDNSGRVMTTEVLDLEGNGVHTLNTSDFSNGFYLIQITSDDGYQEVYRWIKK